MSYDLMFQRAISLYEEGRFDDAEQLLRQILETAPTNPDVLNVLGLIAQAKGIHIEAIELFHKAISNSSSHAPLYFSLAVSLNIWGKPFEAIEAYKKALTINPDIKEAYNNIGNIYTELKKIDLSRQNYKKAIDLDNNYCEAKANLAMTYLNENKDYTIKKLQELHQQFDDNVLILYFLADIFNNEQDYNQALTYINKAYQANSSIDEVWLLQGRIYLNLKQNILAQESFAKALIINPNNVLALVLISNLLTLHHKYDEAETNYKRAIELDANNLDAHINYANLLYLQKRTTEALEEYRKAVIINPNIAEVSNNLGLIMKDIENYDEALGLLFNAFNLKQELEEISINIKETLTLYALSGHKKEAIKIAENWQQTAPDNLFATYCLASLKGENIENNKIYNEKLFDNFADNYELVLQRINYQLPSRIRDIIGNAKGTIVDLGCGSGLVGMALKNTENQIIGIDISDKMLQLAKEKNIYNELIKSDVLEYLKQLKKADLIVAADVFCYFGDLNEIIKSCQNIKLCFSVETLIHTTKDYILDTTGRYQHKVEYLNSLLIKNGYSTITQHSLTLRQENGLDVEGMIFVAE